MSDDLVATSEATRILGYANPASVSRLVTSGRLTPALQLPGERGAYLFHRADIEELAAERRARFLSIADWVSPHEGEAKSRAAHPSTRGRIEPDQANQ